MVITFTLSGDVASLKNSRKAIWNRKYGRMMFVPSDRHAEWHTRASYELKAQMRKLPRDTFPIARAVVTMRFWSSTLIRQDSDNKASSCMDLLVDCGVLKDDSWHIVPEIHLFYMGKDAGNARAEVIIQTL